MKKISIYMLALLGMMGATSCKEEIEPAMPQQNPQEEIFTAGDITSATDGALASGSLTLESYSAAGATVPVMQLVGDQNMPATAKVAYFVDLSDTEDFHRHVTLETTSNGDGIYSVSAADWNAAHVYLFGKSPKAKTAYYRVPAYVNFDGTEYRYQATDYYVASGTVTETCMDMGFTIEDHYYLLGDMTSWSLGDAAAMEPYAFTHESDADVYDDPVFTIQFETTKENSYWKIAPQSIVGTDNWSAVYGPEKDGDESLTGHLTNEGAGAGKIVEVGKYKMTVNFETLEYEIVRLLQPEYLYTPGDYEGWNQENSVYLQLKTGDYYYGAVPVLGEWGFKICEQPKWDNATDWGAAVDDKSLSGDLMLGGGAQNIRVETEGLYWVKVFFDPFSYALTTYEMTPITSVGLIGGFAASGWGSDIAMTTADKGMTWTGTLDLKAGDEFKVRFNGDWGMNFGGDINHLTLDGSNIKAEEAGTYEITLNTGTHFPSLKMTKK